MEDTGKVGWNPLLRTVNAVAVLLVSEGPRSGGSENPFDFVSPNINEIAPFSTYVEWFEKY
ncbi:hypothetical protein A9Q83_11525 [Alphaproteobacteria bacterium 46_93_T64]|nr:hypothetical protein A9Q83_11525 [Alphaproteobacteria bacterium 46_93_T64]